VTLWRGNGDVTRVIARLVYVLNNTRHEINHSPKQTRKLNFLDKDVGIEYELSRSVDKTSSSAEKLPLFSDLNTKPHDVWTLILKQAQ
jgi:hypothetical protein